MLGKQRLRNSFYCLAAWSARLEQLKAENPDILRNRTGWKSKRNVVFRLPALWCNSIIRANALIFWTPLGMKIFLKIPIGPWWRLMPQSWSSTRQRGLKLRPRNCSKLSNNVVSRFLHSWISWIVMVANHWIWLLNLKTCWVSKAMRWTGRLVWVRDSRVSTIEWISESSFIGVKVMIDFCRWMTKVSLIQVNHWRRIRFIRKH